MEKDLRIRILEHLVNNGQSTEETILNDFLGKSGEDLGVIRRSLIELIESGYVKISNTENHKAIQELNEQLNSTTQRGTPHQDAEDKKSCKRFLHDVGNHKKIRLKIRAYATVKGINFLIEYHKLHDDAALSKWQRKAFWLLFTFAILSPFISGLIVTQCQKNTIQLTRPSIPATEDTAATQLMPRDSILFSCP